jgi:tetratricopeptide (TPR) repeat protein
MSAQEVVPLAISAIALGISFYGIFERRNAAYAALRVRITELVDRLGALGVEEQEYRYAHKEMPYDEIRSVVGSIQSRRLVPTYQAIALLERLRSAVRLPFSAPVRLTPQEHIALAESLSILRDLEPARAQWEEAVTAADDATSMVRATVYHGYAGALFALGEAPAGRAAYRRAIESYPDTEAGRWDRFNNYVDWLEQERALDDGEPDEPLGGAQRLAGERSFWQASARERLDEAGAREG